MRFPGTAKRTADPPLRACIPSKRLAARLLLTFCLAGAFLAVTPPASPVTSYGDIDISPEPIPGGRSWGGYVEYRFVIVNRSPRDTHSVTLALDSSPGMLHVSRSVKLGPSSTAQFSLFLPPIPSYELNATVYLDGERQEEPLSLQQVDHGIFGYGRYAIPPCVLVSRDIALDFEKAFAEPTGRREKMTYPRGSLLAKAETPVANWSQNWLGYSRYDGIFVTGNDMRQMPPDVQTAVIRYVECGGSLLVLGSWTVPDTWQRWEKSEAGIRIWHMGFGECLVLPEENIASLTEERRRRLLDSWQGTQQTRRQSAGVEAANEMFPVVEKFGVPVQGMFILVLVFAIVIGPINILIFSRKNRRIRILWTVPAISLVTCLTFAAYALFSEGLRSYYRTESFTILDETSHRATTLGMTAFYSALTPGDGLHFGYETELTPQVEWEYVYRYHSRRGGTRLLNWTNDQHLSRGWITSRVPAHFLVRKSEPRRERVAVRRIEDGSLSAVNGLGANIRELWLADADGNIHHAKDIRAGAEANLSLRNDSVTEDSGVDVLQKAFTSNWLEVVAQFSESPEKHLRPGCYIALLEGAPFIEKGLRGADPTKCRSLVYGILRVDADGN